MARRKKPRGPNRRKVNGVLLLDKPQGQTSNEALQEVKNLFKAQKAGHTGSLDPLATGMLPICFGEATKVSAFLLDANKRYRMTCLFGVKTTTADAEGEVIETAAVPELSEELLEQALSRFRGSIEQIPPMYSALKHNGERLYNLARQGLEVERKPRTVEIFELKLLSFGADTMEVEISCSKGTYVRTLAEDIAAALGTCAHVTVLRRLAVGPYQDVSHTITLERLRELLQEQGLEALDALLLPTESALEQWPDIRLSSDLAFYVRQGQAVQIPRAPSSGWVRLYDESARFMGMGQIQEDGKVAPRRLFAI